MTSFTPVLKSFRVPAKFLIWSRTTSMPRSSDAFSSSVMDAHCGPYRRFAIARIVDVLPVPGGP